MAGRSNASVTRIENSSSRQAQYSKRKEWIIKKANELSVLCDIDVALLMFSQDGQVNTFARNGRVEDIFLRFLKRPDELKGGPVWNGEYLASRMEQSKNEAEMIEKMTKLEALKDTLYKLNRRQCEAQEKMRYYNADVENMTSFGEVGVYQQFLENALKRIENSKEKLFLDGIAKQTDDIIEDISSDGDEEYPNASESAKSNKESLATNDHHGEEGSTSEPTKCFPGA